MKYRHVKGDLILKFTDDAVVWLCLHLILNPKSNKFFNFSVCNIKQKTNKISERLTSS